MDAASRSALIDAWIKYQRRFESTDRKVRLQAEEAHSWAWARMSELTDNQPELAWELIFEILARSPDDHTKGMVVAGPLQGIVDLHSEVFADRIEEQARRSAEFCEMLGGLIAMPDELFQKIQHLMPKRQ